MGTKGDVLLVMVAASLAARAVASSRSIKISANIVVPPAIDGGEATAGRQPLCTGAVVRVTVIMTCLSLEPL